MLKSELATLNDVHEALHEHYKQDGDKFVLLTDGADRLNEFRDNNRNLNADLQEATTKLTAFGDHTPDTIKALEGQVDTLKGDADDAGKKASAKDTDIAQLTANIEKLTGQVETMANANADATAKLAEQTAVSTLTKMAQDAGASAAMITDLVAKARREGWQVDDGTPVQKVGDVVQLSDDNAGQNKAFGEYLTQVFKDQPAYAGTSSGGGGQPPGTPPGIPVISPNDPLALGQHADAIAKGEAVIGEV